MAMELFLHTAGIRISYVPYKSGNAGLSDALAGHVPLMMGSVLSALPHIRAGRLRAYGVSSPRRASGASEIPTLAQAGVPGYQATQWFGIFGPPGLPREITMRLHGLLLKTVQDAGIRKLLMTDGAEPVWNRSPEEFGAFVQAEVQKWAQVVKVAGIKQE
jgi:tripartite-type tricarboxylate transporter receptor subunit TctC